MKAGVFRFRHRLGVKVGLDVKKAVLKQKKKKARRGCEIKEYLMSAVCNYSTFRGGTVYRSGVAEDEK